MTDRHYALFANNQHPIQLEAYETYNNFLRTLHNKEDAAAAEEDGERILEIAADRESSLNKN